MMDIGERITKFRIWNEELKTMDYDGGNLYDLFDFNINDSKYLCLNRFILDISSRFCFMQFIGMHDVNVREIYEGDLVKWREQVGRNDSIINNEDIFGLVLWDREGCKFVISQITKGTWTCKVGDSIFEHDTEFYSFRGEEFNWNELEVIGNICENSDLYNNLKERRDRREDIKC